MSGGSSNTPHRTCCGGCCTLLISLGFVILIYWAIFQPHQIRATVDYAELSNLTVSNASSPVTATYHVAFNLSLYNPSKRVNIYYDTLDAELLFRGAVLSPAAAAASPTEFYQRRRTSQAVHLEFDAGKGVAVPGDVAPLLEAEVKAAAALGLELSVDVRVRYVFGSIKIRQKPKVWCAVSIPVPSSPGGLGVAGSGGPCWVKY
ncbi:hypothetical protein HU200_059707 [Digitaria exilis]|uniref:Late embryogenesis abundant protein LEA-2 subgroup domain-containing protein n=1 Tax=Digitaria exilis TaxID=1010633 RepID=A0A835ABE4_9POAL|nr:hypothetical protein HU200_059707 [Digitaria exilis]CAB3459441.1 unnamed protein product [Digitaria exilis]